MNKFFKICKYSLLAGLPAIILICLWMRPLYPDRQAFEWIFVIALAGFVGIATNTIAIRMLFRPRQPTFFGRQGLIPKNKDRIALKIAEETQQRLLNVETIMYHIEKGHVIEETISTVSRAVEDYLSAEANRKIIADRILGLYNDHADRIFVWLTHKAEDYVSDVISNHATVDAIWLALKPKIAVLLASDDAKRRISGWIIRNLVNRAPEISGAICGFIDTYIEEQVWWKKTVLTAVKELSGMQTAAIAQAVRDILDSPLTYNHVIQLVEDNLISIEQYLEQDEIKDKIAHLHTWLRDTLMQATRERGIPALREKIDSFLGNDASWNTIDRYLVAAAQTVPPRLQSYLHDPATIGTIRQLIPAFIQRLNIKKIIGDNIVSQDTEEFEHMIIKMTAENLAAIEVFGGLLGMLAGVALKKPAFLLWLPLGMGAFVVLEWSLMRVRSAFGPLPESKKNRPS